MDGGQVAQLQQEICERSQISQRTLERYLSGGFEALKPQSKGAHNCFKIPQDLLDEAIQLRRELPSRSIPTIIQILRAGRKGRSRFLEADDLTGCAQPRGVLILHDEDLQRQGLWLPAVPAGTPKLAPACLCPVDFWALRRSDGCPADRRPASSSVCGTGGRCQSRAAQTGGPLLMTAWCRSCLKARYLEYWTKGVAPASPFFYAAK